MEKMTSSIRENLGGNKSKSLEKLNQISDPLFEIPSFYRIDSSEDIQVLQDSEYVAVRSDSALEDGAEKSGAGTFETFLNIPNTTKDIKEAYEKVQEYAEEKVSTRIGVMVQAMVENPEYAGVVFGTDTRGDNPDYFSINYTNGLGNKIVDGDNSTTTKIVHKDYSPETDFEKKLISAVNQICNYYDSQKLDIEFAYKNQTVYILQVRPLTAVSNGKEHIPDKTRERLFSLLEKNFSERFLGDMVDINPVELLGGSRERLINSFFNYIFPQNSLLEAREYFGYGNGEGMDFLVLDKTYIDLEKNLRSFLPATLNEEEIKLFEDYYKNLLVGNSHLQNQLDTAYYPISYERTLEVVNQFNLSDEKKKHLLEKFSDFFSELEEKCSLLAKEYKETEQKLVKKFFPGAESLGEIHRYIPENSDINQIIESIKSLCREFAKHARGAFYFQDQDIGDGEYYHHYKYANQLEKSSSDGVEVELSEGFNFLKSNTHFFQQNSNTSLNYEEEYQPSEKEILETARENIKYMFMLYITALGRKIKQKTGNIDNLEHADFRYLISNIDNLPLLEKYLNRRKNNNDKMREIQMPSSLYSGNHPGMFEILSKEGVFFDFGLEKLEGKTVYIEDIHQYSYEEIQNITQGKVVCFQNATPEIDSYLPYLCGAKAIVTKFGGPGAHIVLKIREMNQNLENKIGLVVGIGDKFNELIKNGKGNIDFRSEKILL